MAFQSIDIRFERFVSHASCRENVRHIKSLPYFSVVQSVTGSYDIGLDRRPVRRTGPGGFFLAPSLVTQNILHCCDPATGRMEMRWLFLDVRLNGADRLDDVYDFPVLLEGPSKTRMNILFNALDAAGEDLCARMSVIYRIVGLLLTVAVPKPALARADLRRVLDYLEEHYAENVRVADLAAAAHLSESHLYACFKARFGVSPIAYLNRYRLTLASDLLQETDLPVAEIAAQVGFPDPLYFSKQFRRFYHIPPRAYRHRAV